MSQRSETQTRQEGSDIGEAMKWLNTCESQTPLRFRFQSGVRDQITDTLQKREYVRRAGAHFSTQYTQVSGLTYILDHVALGVPIAALDLARNRGGLPTRNSTSVSGCAHDMRTLKGTDIVGAHAYIYMLYILYILY